MKNFISNEHQFLYVLTIDFESLLKDFELIHLSLLPYTLFSRSMIARDLSNNEKLIQGKPSYTYLNYRPYLFIDLQTGLCWDKQYRSYVCWLRAINEVIDAEFSNNNKGDYSPGVKVNPKNRCEGGLFSMDKFECTLEIKMAAVKNAPNSIVS